MANEVEETPLNEKPKELSSKEAYFASLAEWMQQMTAAQVMPCYVTPNYNYNNYPQVRRRVVRPVAVRPQNNPLRLLHDVEQRELMRHCRRVLTAPFWKRTLAEFVDALIIFILKVFVTFVFLRVFSIEFDEDFVPRTIREETPAMTIFVIPMDFLSLSLDLSTLILLTKLVICFYECLWITYNDGATPGKTLLQIRVLYVEAVVPLRLQIAPQFIFYSRHRQIWSLVYPAETPSLMRSFLRAFIKNMVLTVFFPICVIIIFMRNNRTTYDIVTKTIVVESNPQFNQQLAQENFPHQQ